MNNPALITIIVVVAIAIIAVVGFMAYRKRRSEQLQSRFGPEYERTVRETGDRARAEAELEQRRRRVERLTIRRLTREDTTRYTEAWNRVQTRFVDDPKGAITEADRLVGDVMSRRGYPMGEFDQRAEDISVNHPKVVENYRTAHAIALRHAKGEASTEDLRQAMIHYRALFAELTGNADMTTPHEPEAPRRAA
jgi:FtsZ-interacting cell division protein ZipA